LTCEAMLRTVIVVCAAVERALIYSELERIASGVHIWEGDQVCWHEIPSSDEGRARQEAELGARQAMNIDA